jgi:hypothetical protein
MTTRTVQFVAYGFSETGNASVTATFNGNTVYSGAIPTQNIEYSPSLDLLPEAQTGFTWEIPLEMAGSYPMTITITGGNTVVIGPVLTNYNTYQDTGIAGQFGDIYPTGPDCRSEVFLNEVEQPPHVDGGYDWNWTLVNGDVLSYNLNISAGLNNTPA